MRFLFAESSRGGWGTQQHCAALATALHLRGHRVQVLLRRGSRVEAGLHEAGVPVSSCEFGGCVDPRFLFQLCRALCALRPQWLVTNDAKFYWLFVFLSRISFMRTACFRHLVAIKPHDARWLPQRADRFYVVSAAMRQDYHLHYRMPLARMRVLYNPVDTALFKPCEAERAQMRSRMGLGITDQVLGFVGRPVADKGVYLLLDAVNSLMQRHARLRIVWLSGGGTLQCQVTASEFAARHIFLEWTRQPQDIYPVFDWLCAPSIYPEPFGRVLIEAQSCGVPVVCSNAGGMPEAVIDGETGFVVPKNDPDALLETLDKLLCIPETRRRQMAVAARGNAVDRFSLDVIAAAFEADLRA